MKKLLISIIILSLFYSCSGDDDTNENSTDLLGKWKLIEELLDTGDGNGIFNPVDSDLIVEFFPNGTVTSINGSLCNPFIQEETESSGTFSINNKTISIGCEDESVDLRYELELDTNFLIVYYSCIEGCAQKYEKTL